MSEQRTTLNLDSSAGGAAFSDDDREAEIHADFSQAVAVDTMSMEWQASPSAGVWRKRLELIGNGDRVTTIVRFEPGSRFDRHGHPGGEEFFVLSGTFSDQSGDFSTGAYVRNPAGWVHAPWTDEGCEIFVKLCQFQPDDKERVVINTQNADWQGTHNPFLSVLALHDCGTESVSLYKLKAGAESVLMDYPRGAEILVIDGEFEDEQKTYNKGSWLRLPAGSQQQLASKASCRFYCKQGGMALT